MKMSVSEGRAQAFVSGFCISDGRGMLGRRHGPWTNLALCGFGPIPIVFRQSVGWRTPFRFVTSGVPPKEKFKAEPWGRVKGQPELRLQSGAYGHGNPNMLSLHPAIERPYLRTGLRLRVTMFVCHLCGPRAMAGPHWTHWYPLH